MHSTISIKFITKIAEFVVSGKVFVVFLMIELMMVHVISTEMPMPCKCVVQSLCSAMPCHAMCNVFILFRLNGINGLEKFFWLEMFVGCHSVPIFIIIVGILLLLAERTESQFGYLCIWMSVTVCG